MASVKILSKIPVVIEIIMMTIGLFLWVPAAWLAFFVYLPNETISVADKNGAFLVFALTMIPFFFIAWNLGRRPLRG